MLEDWRFYKIDESGQFEERPRSVTKEEAIQLIEEHYGKKIAEKISASSAQDLEAGRAGEVRGRSGYGISWSPPGSPRSKFLDFLDRA